MSRPSPTSVTLSEYWLDDLRQGLDERCDPEKAPGMAAYMKGQFEYLGVPTPLRRQAAKPIVTAAKSLDPDHLIDIARVLWAEPEREFHYVGMDALRAGAPNLRASDLERIASFITATPWWDTVDSLAIHTVGRVVANHELGEVMDRWITSDSLWIARSAILHQITYKGETDATRLFAQCAARAEDPEFFIRKAIGWALRQYARTDPEAVVTFVFEHEAVLSGLSKREALKHVAPDALRPGSG